MDGAQFLLWMNLARTLLIACVACWLIFTRARRVQMRTIAVSFLLVLLASNIVAAITAVNVFGVTLW